MHADYIYVVMNGEIIEKGAHKDLILKNGKYKELWSQQVFDGAFIGNDLNSHNLSQTQSDPNLENFNTGTS